MSQEEQVEEEHVVPVGNFLYNAEGQDTDDIEAFTYCLMIVDDEAFIRMLTVSTFE